MTATDPVPTPIVVHATPTQPQIEAAIRQVLLALIPLATAAGMTQTAGYLNVAVASAGTLATVAVFVYGQLITRMHAREAATMAVALPNNVAMTTVEAAKVAGSSK